MRGRAALPWDREPFAGPRLGGKPFAGGHPSEDRAADVHPADVRQVVARPVVAGLAVVRLPAGARPGK